MFRLRRRSAAPAASTPAPRDARRATLSHFEEFVRTRVGVEAYLEPPTQDVTTTLMLIATTGEWTRRRVPDAAAARKVAADLGVPFYDVKLVGYPQRMREWNTRQRKS